MLRFVAIVFLFASASCGDDGATAAQAPLERAAFAHSVVTFEPGDGAGFGQDGLPAIVLGPPKGAGTSRGSLDVVSLGVGGSIVLELTATMIDGEGDDLIVFENAFWVSGDEHTPYAEPGVVGVSGDGETFVEFSCDPRKASGYAGCAGIRPVFANSETNDIDPTDVELAGGDAFDLRTIGVVRAKFVRIRDAAGRIEAEGKSGFDLDAVMAVNTE